MNCLVRSSMRPRARHRNLNNFAAEKLLNQENVMRTVSKFKALPLIRMHMQDPVRKAAVLIPVCVINNKVSILFTQRTSNLRLHKGQVSFPGGMQDSKDKSLQDTALRETREELGIKESDVTVWGMGNPIIARSEMSVVPVIGSLSKKLDLNKLDINPSEVERAFTVPLDVLCKGDNMKYTQFRAGYTTPVFLGGEKRIWGITGIITSAFLKCLLPKEAYTHKIRYIQPIKPVSSKKQHYS